MIEKLVARQDKVKTKDSFMGTFYDPYMKGG